MSAIDAKQLEVDGLLEQKQVEIESNADIVSVLENAERTLQKLDEFCKNKRERNVEKSIVTDIMVCYWNAVGIKLQFGQQNSNTTLLLTNHDAANEADRTCKIEMNISDECFESKFDVCVWIKLFV